MGDELNPKFKIGQRLYTDLNDDEEMVEVIDRRWNVGRGWEYLIDKEWIGEERLGY